MTVNIGLPLKLWPEIIRIIVYLYNYILSKFILEGNNKKLINLIISLFWELNTDCFNLLYHIKYYYLKIYRYRVFIYILKDIKMQSQKLTERIKKDLLVNYKNNLIYWI